MAGHVDENMKNIRPELPSLPEGHSVRKRRTAVRLKNAPHMTAPPGSVQELTASNWDTGQTNNAPGGHRTKRDVPRQYWTENETI